jgi:hypothetical protein
MSLENQSQSSIDLQEARNLMMSPNGKEELDQKDPLFNMKYKNLTEHRKREEAVRKELFDKVLAGTATEAETAVVVEVVKDRPYYVRGQAEYMANPTLSQAMKEGEEATENK